MELSESMSTIPQPGQTHARRQAVARYSDPTSGLTLAQVAEELSQQARNSGLHYGREHDDLIRSFVAAMASKPFAIFSGLSGAGKTRLATLLGAWFGRDHMLVQPVRPDWLTPAAILGEVNSNSESMDSQHAWHVPRSLELILAAARDPHRPYLLVLEEMNLAHVEQYLADVLSGIESGSPIIPNLFDQGAGWRLQSREVQYLPWPENLFLIGTINVDETTYMFSPKVLDRSSTIEFRVLPGDLKTEYPGASKADRGDLDLISTFLKRSLEPEPEWRDKERLAVALQHLHRLLFDHDVEFGHRMFRESLRFGAMLADAGVDDLRKILDQVVLIKVLPKFEHTDGLEPELFGALAAFALHGSIKEESIDPLAPTDRDPVLHASFLKIRRLARRSNALRRR